MRFSILSAPLHCALIVLLAALLLRDVLLCYRQFWAFCTIPMATAHNDSVESNEDRIYVSIPPLLIPEALPIN